MLGLHLGDDLITRHRKGVFALSIFCCDAWPGLLTAAKRAMQEVLPASKVFTAQRIEMTEVKCYSKHWPCLFPQHGPGRVVTEIGSALNGERGELLALLHDNSVAVIVTEHRDRFARSGAEYVEAALAAQGRRLVVTDPSGVDDLVRDVTEIPHVFVRPPVRPAGGSGPRRPGR